MQISYSPLSYKLVLFSFIYSFSLSGKSLIKHQNYKDLRDYWIQPHILANDKVEVERNKVILPWSCHWEGRELMLELSSKYLLSENSLGWPQWQILEVSTLEVRINHTIYHTQALWCIISQTKTSWNRIKYKQDLSFVL